MTPQFDKTGHGVLAVSRHGYAGGYNRHSYNVERTYVLHQHAAVPRTTNATAEFNDLSISVTNVTLESPQYSVPNCNRWYSYNWL